jgi:hypothetical protein
MAEPMSADHEARLRAMLATRGYTLDFSPPDLSSADLAAIRWVLDELGRLRVERDKVIDGCIYDHGEESPWGFTAFPDEALEQTFPTRDEARAYVREIFKLDPPTEGASDG